MSLALPSRWTRLRPRLPAMPPGLGFGLRNAGAALLALYVAFLTSMEQPQWAAMTVFIVAQGDRGMSLAKGRNRIIGTLAGAAMAVVLIALFAQAPELFVIALASWLALCTGVATLLPGFRAYGAVLAGYTATIIGISASGHPERVFDIAVARSTEIVLGILAEAVVAAVFAPGSPLPALQARLERYMRQASELCARLLRGEPVQADTQRFFASALQLDELVQYAAAASREVALAAGRIRRLSYLTLSQLVAAQSCHDLRPAPGQRALLHGLAALLDARAEGRPATPEQLQALRGQLQARLRRLGESSHAAQALERMFLLERGQAMVGHVQAAQYELGAFARGEPGAGGPGLGRHHDYVLALHNALRVFLAFTVASVFWLYSAWSIGAGVVSIVGVVCAIYATRPNPVIGSLGFLKGAACAALVAFLCEVTVMPEVTDFTGLALVFAPILVLGGMAMRRPATAAIGSSFSIFFIDLVGPVNGGNGSVLELFNGGLGLLLGIAIGAVTFSVVLPADFQARLGRLRKAVAADLAGIARHPRRQRPMAWYGRMADRLRLQFGSGPGAGSDEQVQAELGAMLGALTLGTCAMELSALDSDDRAGRQVRAVLRRLARLDMAGLQRRAAALSRRFAQEGQGLSGDAARRPWRRALLLRDMALAARRHGRYLEAR